MSDLRTSCEKQLESDNEEIMVNQQESEFGDSEKKQQFERHQIGLGDQENTVSDKNKIIDEDKRQCEQKQQLGVSDQGDTQTDLQKRTTKKQLNSDQQLLGGMGQNGETTPIAQVETKLSIMPPDLAAEDSQHKELLNNLQDFSPISRMEDSRADVTSQIFDFSIIQSSQLLFHQSSLNSKVDIAQQDGKRQQILPEKNTNNEQLQQQQQQQPSKAISTQPGQQSSISDPKNQKLKERFEKFSTQMLSNIGNLKNSKQETTTEQKQGKQTKQQVPRGSGQLSKDEANTIQEQKFLSRANHSASQNAMHDEENKGNKRNSLKEQQQQTEQQKKQQQQQSSSVSIYSKLTESWQRKTEAVKEEKQKQAQQKVPVNRNKSKVVQNEVKSQISNDQSVKTKHHPQIAQLNKYLFDSPQRTPSQQQTPQQQSNVHKSNSSSPSTYSNNLVHGFLSTKALLHEEEAKRLQKSQFQQEQNHDLVRNNVKGEMNMEESEMKNVQTAKRQQSFQHSDSTYPSRQQQQYYKSSPNTVKHARNNRSNSKDKQCSQTDRSESSQISTEKELQQLELGQLNKGEQDEDRVEINLYKNRQRNRLAVESQLDKQAEESKKVNDLIIRSNRNSQNSLDNSINHKGNSKQNDGTEDQNGQVNEDTVHISKCSVSQDSQNSQEDKNLRRNTENIKYAGEEKINKIQAFDQQSSQGDSSCHTQQYSSAAFSSKNINLNEDDFSESQLDKQNQKKSLIASVAVPTKSNRSNSIKAKSKEEMVVVINKGQEQHSKPNLQAVDKIHQKNEPTVTLDKPGHTNMICLYSIQGKDRNTNHTAASIKQLAQPSKTEKEVSQISKKVNLVIPREEVSPLRPTQEIQSVSAQPLAQKQKGDQLNSNNLQSKEDYLDLIQKQKTKRAYQQSVQIISLADTTAPQSQQQQSLKSFPNLPQDSPSSPHQKQYLCVTPSASSHYSQQFLNKKSGKDLMLKGSQTTKNTSKSHQLTISQEQDIIDLAYSKHVIRYPFEGTIQRQEHKNTLSKIISLTNLDMKANNNKQQSTTGQDNNKNNKRNNKTDNSHMLSSSFKNTEDSTNSPLQITTATTLASPIRLEKQQTVSFTKQNYNTDRGGSPDRKQTENYSRYSNSPKKSRNSLTQSSSISKISDNNKKDQHNSKGSFISDSLVYCQSQDISQSDNSKKDKLSSQNILKSPKNVAEDKGEVSYKSINESKQGKQKQLLSLINKTAESILIEPSTQDKKNKLKKQDSLVNNVSSKDLTTSEIYQFTQESYCSAKTGIENTNLKQLQRAKAQTQTNFFLNQPTSNSQAEKTKPNDYFNLINIDHKNINNQSSPLSTKNIIKNHEINTQQTGLLLNTSHKQQQSSSPKAISYVLSEKEREELSVRIKQAEQQGDKANRLKTLSAMESKFEQLQNNNQYNISNRPNFK